MTVPATKPSRAIWAVLIALLLLYAGLRLAGLMRFPPFIDEAVHVDWANDIYDLHPLTGASNGKLFGLWWAAPLGLFGDGALFLIRAGGILFGMLGATLLYRLAWATGGILAGVLALGLYAVTPYSLFYDRLALMDNSVLPWALLATWAAWRMMRRGSRSAAMLCGVAISGSILAKATGITLAALPLVAVGLAAPQLSRGRRVASLLWSYGVLAIIWGPLYLLLHARGYNYLSTATTVVGSGDVTSLPERLLANSVSMWQIDQTYFSLPFLLLGLGLAGLLIWQRPRTGWFWLATVLVPLGGLLAFSAKLSARYFYFHVPLLIGLVAVALAVLIEYLHRRGRPRLGQAVLLLPAAWVALVSFPFYVQLTRDPAGLALPPLDRLEYISADSAGFALPETAAFLRTEVADPTDPPVVYGLLANCGGLKLQLPTGTALELNCPLLAPDGSTQRAIDAEVNARLEQGRPVWIVYEALTYVSLNGIQADFQTEARFSRPDDLTRITVLRSVFVTD